jgi:hypothetical protein
MLTGRMKAPRRNCRELANDPILVFGGETRGAERPPPRAKNMFTKAGIGK